MVRPNRGQSVAPGRHTRAISDMSIVGLLSSQSPMSTPPSSPPPSLCSKISHPPRFISAPPTHELPRPKPRYPLPSNSRSPTSFSSASSSFTSATPSSSLGLLDGATSYGHRSCQPLHDFRRERMAQIHLQASQRAHSEMADVMSVSGRGGTQVTWSSTKNRSAALSRRAVLSNSSELRKTVSGDRYNESVRPRKWRKEPTDFDDDEAFSGDEGDDSPTDSDCDWTLPGSRYEAQSMFLPSLRRKRTSNAPARPCPLAARKPKDDSSQPASFKRVSLHGLVTSSQGKSAGRCELKRQPLSGRLMPMWAMGKQPAPIPPLAPAKKQSKDHESGIKGGSCRTLPQVFWKKAR
jgi:hypothetical protein